MSGINRNKCEFPERYTLYGTVSSAKSINQNVKVSRRKLGKLRVRVDVRVRQRKLILMDFEQETVLKRLGISHLCLTSEVLGALPKFQAVHTG